MSEKINHNSYTLPAEFMEPQRPVTPEGYSVVNRNDIDDAGLRSIPDSLSPVYMRSATSEKVVKGGKGSEFRQAQDEAYAEREKSRNLWIEQSLGDVALEGSVELVADDTMSRSLDPNFDAEVSSIEAPAVKAESHEQESDQNSGLNVSLIEGMVGNLNHMTESVRNNPDPSSKQRFNSQVMKEGGAAYEAFKAGKISKESYSALNSTLLGAASDHRTIESLLMTIKGAEVLSDDEMNDASSRATAVSELSSIAGQYGDQAKMSYLNSLIAASENLLDKNDGIADRRYDSLVGFIAGFSTQLSDRSASSNMAHGALNQLRKKHS